MITKVKKLSQIAGLCCAFSYTSFSWLPAFNQFSTIEILSSASQFLLQNGITTEKIVSDFLANIKSGASIQEEDLLPVCSRLLAYAFMFDSETQQLIMRSESNIIKELKNFVAKGPFFITGIHGGIIYGQRSSSVTIVYQNGRGQLKQRKYNLSLETIGLKGGLAFHLGAIFITGDGFNYYDSAQTIYLNQGIELSDHWFLGLEGLYCSINTISSCGIWILGVNLGVGGSLSYIFDGTLTPE